MQADMVNPKEKSPHSGSSWTWNRYPEIFCTLSHEAVAPTHSFSLSLSNRKSNEGSPAAHPLNMTDLKSIAAEKKDNMAAAITDLRRDLQLMAMQMDDLDDTTAQHDTAIQ